VTRRSGLSSVNPARRPLAALVALVVVVALTSACGDDPSETSSDTSATGAASVGSSTTKDTNVTQPPPTTTAVDAESYAYSIPTGTGQLIEAGEYVEVLPERLDVKIGDHITIENNDGQDHIIGPFFVAANDTLEYTFVSPGSFSGACSAHSEGEILVVVT
jgi:plastocyanin